jgi:hypothetical protein
MREETFISWYFDISRNPVVYGYTKWSCYFNHENSSLSVCKLIGCDSDTIALSDIAEFVRSEDGSTVVLDNTPEMLALKESLYLNDIRLKVEVKERVGTELEQVTKYSLMFEKKLFYLNPFRVKSDLIFDDFTNLNIIDPIVTDEQTSFPMSQALLLGCHYAESQNYSFGWLL